MPTADPVRCSERETAAGAAEAAGFGIPVVVGLLSGLLAALAGLARETGAIARRFLPLMARILLETAASADIAVVEITTRDPTA